MGIAIHYRGTLDDIGKVDAVCQELVDIGQSMGWDTSVFNDSWEEPLTARLENKDGAITIKGNLGLKGVALSPGDGAEALGFTFDSKGRLRSLMDRLAECEGHPPVDLTWVSVKTQFASSDLHIWIIGLLKYLKKRYMADLDVSDEGDYWETGDRKVLEAKMQFIDGKLNRVSEALTSANLGDMKGLSADEIATRIAQHLQNDCNDDSRPADLE